jgi:hypothetical protein
MQGAMQSFAQESRSNQRGMVQLFRQLPIKIDQSGSKQAFMMALEKRSKKND